MDGDSPINFQHRDARMAAVRALVNKLVDDVEDRVMLLRAVSEYGHAAAIEATDAAKDIIRRSRFAMVTADDADVLDVVGAQR